MGVDVNRYTSIKEAYLGNIRYVLDKGVSMVDERGSRVIEVMNLVSEITFGVFPFRRPCYESLNSFPWTEDMIGDYCVQMLNPNNAEGFVYTYGERLCGFDVNQIEGVIHRLKEFHYSRRATCVTLRPAVDVDREEIPCLIMLDFKVREGGLTVTAVFRSNDVFGASYMNLRGIYNLASYVAANVGVSTHRIVLHQVSAHIYETDLESAERLLENNNI